MPIEDKKKNKFSNFIGNLRKKNIVNPNLLDALEEIPRSVFIPPRLQQYAYENLLIPIACGTYMERLEEQILMLHALDLKKHHKVLEIGTGSGYSGALIAKLVTRITTIERYKQLTTAAQFHYRELFLNNIILEHVDAASFLNKAFSYDRIIIWPSLEQEPQNFLDILPIGGKLIVPIGLPYFLQEVRLYSRTEDSLEKKILFLSRYQPMVSGKALFL